MKDKEEAVLIYLQFPQGTLYSERKLDILLFDVEDVLQEAVEKNKVGTLDGNEMYEDTITYFFYGKDANKIAEVVYPMLSYIPFMKGSYILKRYRDDKEKQIML